MRILIFLGLILISIRLHAQGPHIKLGIEFSTDDITGERFIAQQTNGFDYTIIREETNYNFGLTTTISTQSKFSAQTGLMYSNKDFKNYEVCPACLSIIFPSPELIEQRFLTIPFILNYSFSESKLRPYLQAGIVNNLGLSKDSDFTKMNLMEGQLGFGMAYAISPRVDLSVAYRYRTALSEVYNYQKINTQPSEDYDPNSYQTRSFSIGLNYSIN